MSRTAILATALLFPLAAAAQNGAAGFARQVDGLVTVSQGQSVGLLEPGTALSDGARVVTGSTGNTLLRVGANCDLRLGPNQSVVIAAERACGDLVASIQSIGTPGAAGGTQVAANTILGMPPAVAIGTAALALAGAVARAGRDAPVSGQ